MSVFPSDSQVGGNALRAGAITLHLLSGAAPVRFAAEELQRYLPGLLPGNRLEVYLGPPGESLAAAGFPYQELPQEGSLLVRGDGCRYVVAGGNPAAVLHGAYVLIESLGVRWLKPGPAGELVRPLEGPPPALSLVSTPAFAGRGLADGCLSWWPGSAPFQGWLEEALDLVDWMGKRRMNRLFVHFNRLPPGDLSPLIPELEKRGIALELGGHSLPKLLSSRTREEEPELCRLHRGQRTPDGNFCTSNSRLLRILAEGGRRFAEQLPPAEVYHLWPHDAKEDAWCCCPTCRPLSPAGQMWRAVAAAAEGVAEVRPGAGLSGVLYHELLEAAWTAPVGTPLVFAPRERCYLHPLDGECDRNRLYARQLREAMEQRGESISVLEYYGDPILLGRPANRPSLVGSDLAAYAAAGVRSISTLVFGALSWWLYPVQMYAYTAACWEPKAVGDALQDYCRFAAGRGGGEQLARYYGLEEEAVGSHLRFCGYGLDGSWATLPFPPTSPLEEAREHLARMERGEALLREAGVLLEGLAGQGEGGNNLLSSALAAHRLEEAFHRGVIADLAEGLRDREPNVGAGVPAGPNSPHPDPLPRGEGDHVGAGVPAGPPGPMPGPLGGQRRAPLPEPGRPPGHPSSTGAFEAGIQAAESARPEDLGVFGRFWMLPWLRRCSQRGTQASP